MSTELRNFLALSYDELEELNLKAKEERRNRVAPEQIREGRLKYLRGFLDPRFHRSAGVRSPPGHRLGSLLLGAGGRVWSR